MVKHLLIPLVKFVSTSIKRNFMTHVLCVPLYECNTCKKDFSGKLNALADADAHLIYLPLHVSL